MASVASAPRPAASEMFELKLPRRIERSLLKHFSNIQVITSSREDVPWSMSLTPKARKGKEPQQQRETVFFNGYAVQQIVRNLLMNTQRSGAYSNLAWVQQRGFKTVRSVSAEQKRNPGLFTRVKDTLGEYLDWTRVHGPCNGGRVFILGKAAGYPYITEAI